MEKAIVEEIKISKKKGERIQVNQMSSRIGFYNITNNSKIC